MKQLLTILFFFTIASLLSQSEGGFGFRRFADLTALNATSVNNSDKSASRRAYVNSTGLYYVWNGSAWIAEVAIDTFSVSGSTLSLSLLRDGVPAKTVTIDPSVTNEGQLNVSAIAPPNAGVITSNTSGSNTIIIQGGTGITVTPNPGTHTITIEGGAEGLIDTVKNIDSLRTYSGTRPIVFVKDEPQTGFFKMLDSTVVDDGGILIHGVFDWTRIAENLNEVNIKWFGAVGDSSNAEAAKNLAVAYCAANRNTTLYIPGGKYYFTTPIYIYRPQNIGIKGDGPYATYLFFKDCDGISLRTDSVTYQTNAFYGVVDGRDLIIKDLSIYRVGTYTTKKTGILLRGVGFNIKLSDLRVQLYTSILGTIGSVGINLTTASTSLTDAVQHTVLSNVYVTECDTNVVSYLRNTMEWNNVNIDQANEVGVVLNNSLHWSGGMLQGSNKCGLFLVNKNPYVLYDVRLEKLHIEGAAGQPVYGQIYKPDATDMKNLTIKNSVFSAGGNSMIMNLKRVLYMDITDNSYNAGTTDTIKLTSIYSGRFGNDNFTSAKLVTSDVYINWWNGSPSAVSTLVGFTIGKSSPGRNFLNVGGDTGIDGELGVGTQIPLSQFHVSTGDLQDTTIIRMQNSTGFTQLFRGTATPEGDVEGNPGDFFYSNISGTGDWFGKLTGTGNTGWVEFYHTGNLPSSNNIYTSDGQIDSLYRTLSILQQLDFTGTGYSQGFNVNLYRDSAQTVFGSFQLSPALFNAQVNYNTMQSYMLAQSSENAGNPRVQQYYSIENGGSGLGSASVQQKMTKDSLALIDGWNVLMTTSADTFQVAELYMGKNLETAYGDFYSSRYAFGVQLKITGADSTHFDFIKVNLDEGRNQNSISFYDKYNFPNQTPSPTVGDSSVIVWVGNGTTATPMFAPYTSGGGSGTNLYNSNGTTTDNTRTATITESIQWIGTADTGNPYPFQVHVTGNEPPIQLWKGNTDSVWIKQSDVEYYFGSSTHFVVQSTDYLTLAADSIQMLTLTQPSHVQNIMGITDAGIVQKIKGASNGYVLSWNNAGNYWESVAPSSDGNGIYGGSGSVPDNTVATVASSGDFRFAYNGGNPAFSVDDALNQTYISGKDGTYSAYADNSNVGLVAGTGTWLVGSTYALTATASVAATNTATDRLVIKTNSTGTPSTNFGGSILFQGESSTTDNRDMIGLSAIWATATDASRTSALVYKDVSSAGALTERFRFTPSSMTTATSFTIGNSSSSLTLGGSSGTVVINSSAASAGAVTIQTSGNNSSGTTFGNTGFSLTTLSKKIIDISNSYTAASGTGVMTSLSITSGYNLTGTASGNQIGIDLNPTLTSLTSATYTGINIPYSNSAARGIYQTGSSTTNNFVGATGFGATTTPTDKVEITGNLALLSAGNKIKIATGSNASLGTATLVGGTITVNTTAVTASSKIFLTYDLFGGTPGSLEVGTITAGTSFVINSSSALDTSDVNWIIFN